MYTCIYSWLIGFYGISNHAGYLIPNPIYTYISYMICEK